MVAAFKAAGLTSDLYLSAVNPRGPVETPVETSVETPVERAGESPS